MEFERIEKALQNDPDLLYRLLRDESLEVRLTAFDTFIKLLDKGDSGAKKLFSDFITVVRIELIPNLSDESDIDKRGGLIHVLKGIQKLCNSSASGGSFVAFIDTCLQLTKHPYSRIKATTLLTLGKLFRKNPDELDDSRANRMLRFFNSNEAEVRAAAAAAWSDISSSSTTKAEGAISSIYGLLQDNSPSVRAEAAGFFHSLADGGYGESAVALPLLRKMKQEDPDELARERAGAAAQAINNSIGDLF